MLIALLGLAFVLICSSLALLVGVFKSARARGGLGRGRMFDRIALPWTVTSIALLLVVSIGLLLVWL